MNHILVTLHGGCFVGGSADWDAAQTKCLRNLGIEVYQLDFPKDEFNETIEYICNFIQDLKKRTEKKISILGRSSGGYLAKVIFNLNIEDLHKAFYLAPVFNPKTRAIINPKFKGKQEYYFREVDVLPSTSTFNPDREILFLADADQNVSRQCFTEDQLNHAIRLGIANHSSMTCTVSKAFQNKVIQFLEDIDLKK